MRDRYVRRAPAPILIVAGLLLALNVCSPRFAQATPQVQATRTIEGASTVTPGPPTPAMKGTIPGGIVGGPGGTASATRRAWVACACRVAWAKRGEHTLRARSNPATIRNSASERRTQWSRMGLLAFHHLRPEACHHPLRRPGTQEDRALYAARGAVTRAKRHGYRGDRQGGSLAQFPPYDPPLRSG